MPRRPAGGYIVNAHYDPHVALSIVRERALPWLRGRLHEALERGPGEVGMYRRHSDGGWQLYMAIRNRAELDFDVTVPDFVPDRWV